MCDTEVYDRPEQRFDGRFGDRVAAEKNEADHHNDQTSVEDCSGLFEVVRKQSHLVRQEEGTDQHQAGEDEGIEDRQKTRSNTKFIHTLVRNQCFFVEPSTLVHD